MDIVEPPTRITCSATAREGPVGSQSRFMVLSTGKIGVWEAPSRPRHATIPAMPAALPAAGKASSAMACSARSSVTEFFGPQVRTSQPAGIMRAT